MFVGRKREMEFLQKCYDSPKAELVVIYGRRRIGKTELLKQFSHGKQAVFYACTECTAVEQLDRFSKRLLNTGMPASNYLNRFVDWDSAFRSIADIPAEGKKVLIIDEFPYMCKGTPEIPSILQNMWDHELSDQNIMLILCGSSVSFMEDELLGEKNPLYGRATGVYKLQPLSFTETKEFFPECTLEEQIVAYAILGGIPYYLEQFDSKSSLAENVKANILRKGCVLYNEVEFLLRQELRETSIYNTIIEAVALGNNTLALIHSKTQLEKSKITAYLRNLMELGIVEREFSVLATAKEREGSQRGLYQLTDSYFRFWYSFVYSSISELEAGDIEGIWQYQIEPQLHQFVSHNYEKVCIEYLRRKNQDGKLPFRFTQIGRWWDKVVHTVEGKRRTVAEEIDIVATNRMGNEYLLGECKFRHQKAGEDVLRHLQQKFPVNKYKGKYYYVIFSFYGFTEDLLKVAADENVLLVGDEV
ncbi:ATP-binding protein [Anaerovibrio lipolyticus]|uniref:ATP-binding protein n=1 Tax=Anaerovibrio lipolyticus TaxID=82374 RepID=UPI0026F01D61|nr:ATP-binding protein [Anaerovibrio lipolyticus]MBE6105710.1 ATP-binding protein [Anaerovibrio lipolyticus]